MRSIGPTGNYPDGKISDDDDGELALAIRVNKTKNLLEIDFGVPLRWFALGKDAAMEFAAILERHADELEDD